MPDFPANAVTPVPEIERIVLLGHTGFIGGHLACFFRERFPAVELAGYSAPEMDLTHAEDADSLAGFLDLRTAVVMLAGVKRQFGDNLDTFSQNVQMAANLCRLLERRPVRRLVFFSSAAVYGEEVQNPGISEETPVHPTSLYGAAKYASECLFQKIVGGHGQSSLLILRPPLIYGPGDTGSGYGPSGFVTAAVNGEPITLWGDGTEKREFLFIDDVVEIVGRLALGRWSGVLNVASGKSCTYVDILNGISKTLGSRPSIASRPRTKDKVDHGFSNATLARLFPGFRFTAIEEGIRRLAAAHQFPVTSHAGGGG